MNRRGMLTLVSTIWFALLSGSAFAQQTSSLKDQLVGTWTLTTADAFGTNPKGVFIFDANGHFTTALIRASLPKIAANSRLQGTPDENKAIVGGSLVFFGTYAVNGTDLNLRIEGSSFPNWEQTNQKRTNVSISGDELKYTQPTPSDGGPATVITWKRAK
jgi:Lipocalin-like domain